MTKQEIIDHFKDIDFMYNDSSKHETLSRMIDELLSEQPQIIRCKDCVYAESFFESYKCYFDEENESGCKRSHDADFFCAYGERRTDDG